MRPDQLERLALLSEQLAEVVIADCDPSNWVGAGRKPKELTAKERGDGFWCRKQANASVGLLLRIEQLREDIAAADPDDFDAGIERQKMIKAAENQATEMLARWGGRK
ncbi:hypothetical protein ACOPJQ_02400 [Luteimonas dalianensis]